jgi:hypothetical protein
VGIDESGDYQPPSAAYDWAVGWPIIAMANPNDDAVFDQDGAVAQQDMFGAVMAYDPAALDSGQHH